MPRQFWLLLFLAPLILSAQSDSARAVQLKNYNYSRLHFFMGYGPGLSLKGGDFDASVVCQGRQQFASSVYKTNNNVNFSLSYSLARNLRLGVTIFPRATYFYSTTNNSTVIPTWATEHTSVSAGGLDFLYAVLPYRAFKKTGLEVSAGGGVLLSWYQTRTQMAIADTFSNYYAGQYYSPRWDKNYNEFSETRRVGGAYAAVDVNFYVLPYLSVFARVNWLFAPTIKLREKQIWLDVYETIRIPPHQEWIKGLGFNGGIALHLFN